MRAFKVENMVMPIFLLPYECFLFSERYKVFILIIVRYVNLQNMFCCSFHSQNEYKHGRKFLLKGNFYSLLLRARSYASLVGCAEFRRIASKIEIS